MRFLDTFASELQRQVSDALRTLVPTVSDFQGFCPSGLVMAGTLFTRSFQFSRIFLVFVKLPHLLVLSPDSRTRYYPANGLP